MLDVCSLAEDTLITQAQKGDRSAFGELVARHYASVIRVVYHLCGQAQVAQDAAQEAFIRAWVNLPGFQPRASFRNWLFRIATNAALDILRQRPEESIEDSAEMPAMVDQSPNPEAAYLEKEQADFLQAAVQALPEGARSVLVLREYGELSYEEIAAALEIPIGTVMSRLNYARSRLRELLREHEAKMEREYA